MRSWIAVMAAAFAVLSGVPVMAQHRPEARVGSDLPPYRVTLPLPPSEAFLTADFVSKTLPAVRAHAEALRRDYRIVDPSLANKIAAGLAAIAALQGRLDDADSLIAEYRATAPQTQAKAVGLLQIEAIVAGRRASAMGRCAAQANRFRERLRAHPAPLVRDEAIRRHAAVQTASEAYYASTASGGIDAEARARGSIGLFDVLALAQWRLAADELPACRAVVTPVLREWLDTPANRPVDIWAARAAPPAPSNAPPVVVAVWDSGFDPTIFAGQLAFDPAEPIDNRDNDGNGVVDDNLGPTFDYEMRPTIHPVIPPSAALRDRLTFQMTMMKGERDLSYGLDTPDAAFFAVRGREASTAEQATDVALLGETGARQHGTAVASVIADDAPYVRLFNVFMLPFGTDDALPIDEAMIDRWVAQIDRLPGRLASARVRVANLSWIITAEELTQKLLNSGTESDQPRAIARGQAMQAKAEAALRRLVAAAPNVLFVAGAGNSGGGDGFLRAMPQGIAAPNLIVVGAAGIDGMPTAWTTFGEGVQLYALGQAVPVRWPGGGRATMHGTSLAAPQVARAAAAMLAVNPNLSAAQLADGLRQTATKNAQNLNLLHPADAVAWARTH